MTARGGHEQPTLWNIGTTPEHGNRWRLATKRRSEAPSAIAAGIQERFEGEPPGREDEEEDEDRADETPPAAAAAAATIQPGDAEVSPEANGGELQQLQQHQQQLQQIRRPRQMQRQRRLLRPQRHPRLRRQNRW